MMMLHAYPFLPALEQMFQSLATEYDAPTLKDIQASADESPMDAEWAALEAYTAALISIPSHDWVPLQDWITKNMPKQGSGL